MFFSEGDLFDQRHVDSVEFREMLSLFSQDVARTGGRAEMQRLASCIKETYGIEYTTEEIERLS